MTKGNCESCGARPPRITEGEFAGQSDLLDYCEFCSMDLCVKCMTDAHCMDSDDGKHKAATEDDND